MLKGGPNIAEDLFGDFSVPRPPLTLLFALSLIPESARVFPLIHEKLTLDTPCGSTGRKGFQLHRDLV